MALEARRVLCLLRVLTMEVGKGRREWALCWETGSGHYLLERGLIMDVLECPLGHLDLILY